MNAYHVVEVKQSIMESNMRKARKLRKQLKEKKVFLLNLMSSPGAGKTSALVETIEALAGEMNIAVIEADIDSDVDARAISKTGAKTVQLHTGGMCHLDANMTELGLSVLDTEGLDLVFIENVGNLVCPAEFDTGAMRNAMILSIPEGDDKPLKYPLMFTLCDVLLINKIDAMQAFDFDIEACRERALFLNPDMKIIPISAKTGEGIDEWADWLRDEVASLRAPADTPAGKRPESRGNVHA